MAGTGPKPPADGSEQPRLARWVLGPAAAGPVLGTVWWLAAPGGLLHGEGSDYRSWDERDLVLAALGAAAGLAITLALAAGRRRPGLPDRAPGSPGSRARSSDGSWARGGSTPAWPAPSSASAQ